MRHFRHICLFVKVFIKITLMSFLSLMLSVLNRAEWIKYAGCAALCMENELMYNNNNDFYSSLSIIGDALESSAELMRESFYLRHA